ncbi:DUF881 domain-containing protein [Desulfitobacterium sp.]|uniref:DUF881 domain-containing protein n=1 Tax=Desulfitobacterium sp. TaxID=49981 RepID=UPI002B21010F|nr:DUF881 domain-containing protein [Desulfitobacterium sp.]MEA4902851.1 DUF881 domain-containing protein [Desulfitobacterium sp.]
MTLPKKGKLLIAMAACIIGALFVILIKTTGTQGSLSTRSDTVVPSLIQVEQENQQLVNDNEKLKQELKQYQMGENANSLTFQQLQKAKVSAGLTEVKGLGIRITLDDAKTYTNESDDPNYYLIHEEYIRQIVNWLWNGGAEAISVNGQRITSATEVFCSGSYIQINGTLQMAPYIIEAVGDQHNLQSALKFYFWDRLGEYQQQYGITRTLEAPDETLTIPAGQLKKFKYAEPVKGG